MTFSITELLGLNSPIELYEFTRGVNVWRFTSSDTAQMYNSQIYAPIPISRGKITRSQVIDKAELNITVTRDLDMIQSYIAMPPGETMTLVIYSLHKEDADTVVRWRGRVMNVKWEGIKAEILCEPIYTSLRGQGLRRKYGPGCSHALYDLTPLTCQVIKESFQLVTNIISVNKNVLESADFAAQADGYYNGGFMFWIDVDGTVDKRMIVDHSTSFITLISAMPGLKANDKIWVYPGCNHTMSDCLNKFNNLDNYGGFPYSPDVTPFNTPLY